MEIWATEVSLKFRKYEVKKKTRYETSYILPPPSLEKNHPFSVLNLKKNRL